MVSCEKRQGRRIQAEPLDDISCDSSRFSFFHIIKSLTSSPSKRASGASTSQKVEAPNNLRFRVSPSGDLGQSPNASIQFSIQHRLDLTHKSLTAIVSATKSEQKTNDPIVISTGIFTGTCGSDYGFHGLISKIPTTYCVGNDNNNYLWKTCHAPVRVVKTSDHVRKSATRALMA